MSFEGWMVILAASFVGLLILFVLARINKRGSFLIRMLVRLFAAFFLMLPVYDVLVASLQGWLTVGSGWRTLAPWLDFLTSLGLAPRHYLLIGTFLAVSFLIAIPLGWIIELLFRRLARSANA